MADTTVPRLLTRLATLIEQNVREEVCLLLNSNNEVKNLSYKLKKIQEVLTDAEQKRVIDAKVKSWLDKLQDIAYEIDDVLDEWEAENIRQQLEESEDASRSSDPWEKVSSFFQSFCLCFRQAVHRRSIALEIKQINERLDSIAQENENEFKFIPNISRETQDFKPNTSTSFFDVSEVHGRDLDNDILVSKLLSENSSRGEDGIQIISLVGAGGMGKTTLAQLVYNDDRLKGKFDAKIWICVSDPFDEIKIATAILGALLGGSSPNISELDQLLQRIKESISGKRFLLCLDDVWAEYDGKWTPLKMSLESGAHGSRILVTTRKENVADMMDSTYVHSLQQLSDSNCWSILSQIALRGREDSQCEMLKEIGQEIVKKCKGLPLAAKTLGGLLRFKSSVQEWQNVLKSEMWELEKVKTNLFPFLTLSYDELHPTVKRCFSYCAIFPKDEKLNVDDLIRFWMAQGFLSSSEMELGRSYFVDLAMRSFFQDFETDEDNRIIECKMHDIIHDYAQFLTENECLIVKGGEQRAYSQNARHLNVDWRYDVNIGINPSSICDTKRLRSFFGGSRNPPDLLSHLQRVRLLSFYRQLKDIPKEIANLIHIRYLGLRYDLSLVELPETICELYNLQTLDIRDCMRLRGLPEAIHKLRNLRHLLNDRTSSEFKFPQGFEKLTNLRTLDNFNATTDGNKLGYLKDLNQLGGSLRIWIHDGDVDVEEAKKAGLKDKEHIRELDLHVMKKVGLEVIEALQPPPYLKILYFEAFQLPEWISTLNKLTILTISYQGYSLPLPPLGKLPLLEDLILWGCKMEQVGHHEFLGINKAAPRGAPSVIFPKLKKLAFIGCPDWKEWEDISEEEEEEETLSILPSLQELILNGCSQLKALPHRLLRKASSLKLLDISCCTYLESRYSPEEGEDWDKVSHIRHVEI